MTAAAPPATLEGAVVFTDMVGFTEFTAHQGDEQALALLSMQDGLVRDSLPEDARVVKELGDGLLLWFADACAALETALTLSGRFEELDEQSIVPVGVRIGINWGQYLRRGDDIVGHCVNVASRIVNVAGPGEVLVSDTLVARVEADVRGVEFDELGPVVMKGIPEPVRLFRAYRCRD